MIERYLRLAFAAASCTMALTACDFPKTVEADPAGRAIPAALCGELDEVVAVVRKQTGMEFEGEEAIIEDAAWRAMGGGQDRLAQALAYRLACAAAIPPPEQSVTIRNEWGVVLTRRTVSIETRAEEESGA